MNIFENYRATKLYIELLQGFEQQGAVVSQEFRDRIKELFHTRVLSEKELENYKLTEDEVQEVADRLWSESL